MNGREPAPCPACGGARWVREDDQTKPWTVHISQLNGQRLTAGDRIEYALGDNPRDGREMATNIRVLSTDAREAAHVVFGDRAPPA